MHVQANGRIIYMRGTCKVVNLYTVLLYPSLFHGPFQCKKLALKPPSNLEEWMPGWIVPAMPDQKSAY